METKSAQASITAADTGEFDMILSTDAVDRQGETISPKSWIQPLPDTIPINVDHAMTAGSIVGSGKPFIDAVGNLRVTGKFSGTPEAQRIRQLVTEGHLTAVSVEFRRLESGNELLGGAFVYTPANPTARVLTSKSVDQLTYEQFEARLKAIIRGEADPIGIVKKAAGGDGALLQSIHDAACWLGAACQTTPDQDPSGESDGANKAAALQLRLKALAS